LQNDGLIFLLLNLLLFIVQPVLLGIAAGKAYQRSGTLWGFLAFGINAGVLAFVESWREQDSNHRFRGGRARRFVCRFSFTPTFRLAGNQLEATLKAWSYHAGPMVRILFPPAKSLLRTLNLSIRLS